MKNRMIWILLIFLFSVSGCEDFVKVSAPKNQLIGSAVFSNDGHAIAALTGIYSQMYNTGNNTYNIPFKTGIASDELTNYSTNATLVQLYQNSLHPLDAATNAFWINPYNFINQANAIWEGCEQSTSLSEVVKKQLQAEALFIRAFWYFYLVNFYGDVPLLTSTDYKANALAGRAPSQEVYKQIIEDLEYAAQHLNANYVDATSVTTSAERVRPNKFTAKALLARVYLYLGEWQKAEQSATSVISQTSLYDIVPLDQVFLKNNKEAIWQLPKPGPAFNMATQEAIWFILTSKPSSNALNNCAALSPQLLAAFEEGDLRRTNWVNTFADTTTMLNVVYPYPFKYKIANTADPSEYSTVFRLAEQYLIRAEALTHMGDMVSALADLNLIRARAGLAAVSAIDKEEFLKILLHERQVELFTEWGHRWMDLKRTGHINDIMEQVSPFKGGTWDSYKQWFPIPQRELESNPNLKQNIGYN